MPKVSICIPAYNQTEYLSKTFDSILIQTYKDYEVIVTDDSPGNEVQGLVEKYNSNGKFSYYRNGTPLGSPANWNACITKAKGDYIKIMHHDDWFSSPKSLEKLVTLLEKDNSTFAFCGCDNISTQGKNLFHHSITHDQANIIKSTPEFLFFNNRIGAPSVSIFRKNNFLFDEKIKYLVDIEFYIKLIKSNPQFSYTQETLVNIGHNDGQISNSAIQDKKLLLFEYSYTYRKLNFSKSNFKWAYNAFWNLFYHLNIWSVNELKENGWGGAIPLFVVKIIAVKNLIKKAHLNRFKVAIKHSLFSYLKLIGNY